MPVHDAHLLADPGAGGGLAVRGAVVPEAHRHVVAGADEDVAGVRTPGELADGVLVALHEGHGPAGGVANVKGAQDAVYAAGGDDGVVVLVPVVGEDLGGRAAAGGHGGGRVGHAGLGAAGAVDGDGRDEVVLCRGRGAQVEEADVRVGRDGGDEGRVGRAEGGAVCAVANGQGLDGEVARGRPLCSRVSCASQLTVALEGVGVRF